MASSSITSHRNEAAQHGARRAATGPPHGTTVDFGRGWMLFADIAEA